MTGYRPTGDGRPTFFTMIFPPAIPEDRRFDGLVVFRGSPVSLGLQLFQKDGTTPIDLTNLTPFKCQLRANPEGALVLELTVVVDEDPETGKLVLAATRTATANVPECNPTWDLIDNSGYIWVSGVAKVRKKNSRI